MKGTQILYVVWRLSFWKTKPQSCSILSKTILTWLVGVSQPFLRVRLF